MKNCKGNSNRVKPDNRAECLMHRDCVLSNFQETIVSCRPGLIIDAMQTSCKTERGQSHRISNIREAGGVLTSSLS